jgi:carbonic anhydrase
MTPQEALDLLKAGNQRFVTSAVKHDHQDAGRREAVLQGQKPFSAILSCSDSRVPPEIIFDQGIGDIFVVRVAGNIFNEVTAASMEYAAAHLNVRLLVVLGHTSCGAINAALHDNGMNEGLVPRLLNAIKPSVSAAGCKPDADAVARLHAQKTAEMLLSASRVLRNMVNKETLRIIPMLYDLKTGKVEVLS